MKNRHYLTIQIGSYKSGNEIIKLLELPCSLVFTEEYKISSLRWNEGKTIRNTFKYTDKFNSFLSKVSDKKFNEMVAKITFQPFTFDNYKIKVSSIESVLYVSPKNSIWGNVYGYTLDKKSAEKARRSFQSTEISLRWSEIERYPSLLFSVIEMISHLDYANLVETCAEIINQNIPISVLNIEPFGCADITEKPIMFNMLEILASHPKVYPFLDQKFDGFHNILIGKGDLCLALYRQIKNKFNYLESKENSKRKKYGIVYTANKDDLDNSSVKNFFVNLDASTAPDLMKPENGDYKIGSKILHTHKRLCSLMEKKMLPNIEGNDIKSFPLINAKYLSKIGIEMDDVLMSYHQPCMINDLENEIDSNYRSLTDIKDEKKRVWEAHKKAFGNWRYGLSSEELINTIYKLYFS